MNKPVFVTVSFHSKPDQVAGMKALLQEIITNTLSHEPGCVSYSYLQDVDDESHFTSLEVWKDASTEAAHWNEAHLAASLQKLPALLAGEPVISKWHRI